MLVLDFEESVVTVQDLETVALKDLGVVHCHYHWHYCCCYLLFFDYDVADESWAGMIVLLSGQR